jgi:hypothetical protein
MGREYEEERLFSEKIDRLLAGEKIRTDEIQDGDLRSALDFAQKMIDLRAAPSVQFESRLKAGLLQQLNEKENNRAARQGWFWKLIPSQPLFQAVAVLAVMFIVGGVLWATLFRPAGQLVVQAPGITPPITSAPFSPVPAATTVAAATTAAAPAAVAATTAPAPTAVPATTAPPIMTTAPASQPSPTAAPSAPGGNVYLRSSASTDKDAYLPGELINIQVKLTNITQQPVVLKEFPPSLSLMQSDSRKPVYTFNSGPVSRTLSPGETAAYNMAWNQIDDKGRHVSPGGYYLEMEEVYRQGQSVRMDLASPVYFQILPPPSSSGGTGGSTRGLHMPLTVNGITVTLLQLEFTASGVTVTAFITPPPDYSLKQNGAGLSPSIDYRTQARYAVNGSWFEKTEQALVEYFAEGMLQTWFIPLQSPAEITDLDLVIDNVGNWAGPWEFRIAVK